MANKPNPADFAPDVPDFPSVTTFLPCYGKFDLTTYIQGASDYEIMCNLVQLYNTMAKGYNDIEKLSTDTQKAYIQLQNFVNTWFDGLDVTEEVGVILLRMANDGSLANVIGQTGQVAPATKEFLNTPEGLVQISPVINTSVRKWLDDHPEATTTVQDGSLTYNKLVKGTLGYVTPEMYGAVGDGIADDTEAINNAFSSGYIVVFLHKTYLIDGTVSSEINNGVIIGNNATLKIKPNSSESYNGLIAKGKCYITDLIVLGERKEHSGTTGEWGNGIVLQDSHDTVVNNVTCNDCWGDGLYIGVHDDNQPFANNNITVLNSRFDNNRRNGISVIHGTNILIKNCVISNTNGTNPQTGIDVEPNNDVENADVTIEGCTFIDNVFGNVTVQRKNSKVLVSNCISENKNKYQASEYSSYNGILTLSNITVKQSKRGFCYATGSTAVVTANNVHIIKLAPMPSSPGPSDSFLHAENGSKATITGLTCDYVYSRYTLFYGTGETTEVTLSDISVVGEMSHLYHLCKFSGKNLPIPTIGSANFTVGESDWWPEYYYDLDYDGVWTINATTAGEMTFIPRSNKKITLAGNVTYEGAPRERITIYKDNGTYRVMNYGKTT